jgi:hypothetical protein
MRQTWILAALLVLLTACGPQTLPNVAKFDLTEFPESAWAGPPKTWLGQAEPGQERTVTLMMRSPSHYVMQKEVNTLAAADGEDGVLRQELEVPLLAGDLSTVQVVSEYAGDDLVVEEYRDGVLVVSGFERVPLDRIVTFAYRPEMFTFVFAWRLPVRPDSGKRLVDPPDFEPLTESIDWVTFEDGRSEWIAVRVSPDTVHAIDITLAIPEDAELPDYGEFHVTRYDVTGAFADDPVYAIETNWGYAYKVLVSPHVFRFARLTEEEQTDS